MVKNQYFITASFCNNEILKSFFGTYPRELWNGLSKFSKKFTFLCQIFCFYSIYVLHTTADWIIKPSNLKYITVWLLVIRHSPKVLVTTRAVLLEPAFAGPLVPLYRAYTAEYIGWFNLDYSSVIGQKLVKHATTLRPMYAICNGF